MENININNVVNDMSTEEKVLLLEGQVFKMAARSEVDLIDSETFLAIYESLSERDQQRFETIAANMRKEVVQKAARNVSELINCVRAPEFEELEEYIEGFSTKEIFKIKQAAWLADLNREEFVKHAIKMLSKYSNGDDE